MRKILFSILLFISTTVSAQRPFSRDFWLNEAQTPVNVNAISETSNGYIWVGTDDGLYRFNGREFTFITDSIKIPVTAVLGIGNEVYVGYNNGTLAKVYRDKIVKLHTLNRAPHTAIRSIHATGNGVLWLCTEEGIFIYTNGCYYNINDGNGLADNFTYELGFFASSCILVGTDNGICKLDFPKGRLATGRYGTQQGLPDNIVNVVRPVTSSFAWVGTHEGGVAQLWFDKKCEPHFIRCQTTWKWGAVTDIIPVSEKEAWVSTEEGYLAHITCKDSTKVEPYHFPGKNIKKLLRIRSGNIWCATNEGLTIVTVAHARYTIVNAPYFFTTLTAMACEGNDKLWLGQERELLSMPLNKDTTTPKHEAMLPANITCMYTHRGGGIWLGTFGEGLWHYDNGKLQEVNDIESLEKGNILSVTTFNHHLWVASLNGVDELDVSGDKMRLEKHHNKSNGIGSDYVYQLYNDKKGKLWFATDGAGVTMYDGKQYHQWDSSNGMTCRVVYSVAVDAFGHVWAGTPDKGVFRYDGKKWQQFTMINGLQDMSISSVITNKTGQVLVISQKGIDEWFPKSNLFRRFNKKTNLDVERISTALNCVSSDASGNVYIPFDKGFTVFTNVPGQVELRPGISINQVSLFFKPLLDDRDKFNYDENQLTFDFEGINYSNVERLHYRYKLEGYSSDWVYTNDQSVTFSQLPSGKFNFIIQASLDKDFEEANEARYAFSISTPFWRSPVFLILVVAFAFGLLYLYIKLRERSLRKVNRLQEERMRFEYEHLRSQVNPHFLFNSLNTLSSLIEEDKGKAIDYTTQLSDLYRSVLSHRNMDLIRLADEMEIINNYMYIQKTRFGDALRLEVEIPQHILETKKIIPLALQILVENAIKHNVVSRSEPLIIYISANEEQVTVKNDLRPKITKEKGEGLGLSNIRRRYSLITKKDISYTISNNQYIVTLPLL
jgi:ligand-binding sensor domain-containing protein